MAAPKGFRYSKDVNGKIRPYTLYVDDTKEIEGVDISFWIKAVSPPELPFIYTGELWHTGWDIPTRYVIDASKRCWMNNAHGGVLNLVNTHELLYAAEQYSDRDRIRRLLGKKSELPTWIKTALKSGWTPPDTFDRGKYE